MLPYPLTTPTPLRIVTPTPVQVAEAAYVEASRIAQARVSAYQRATHPGAQRMNLALWADADRALCAARKYLRTAVERANPFATAREVECFMAAFDSPGVF